MEGNTFIRTLPCFGGPRWALPGHVQRILGEVGICVQQLVLCVLETPSTHSPDKDEGRMRKQSRELGTDERLYTAVHGGYYEPDVLLGASGSPRCLRRL